MTKFKAGDRVVCVEASNIYDQLTEGAEYEVIRADADGRGVTLKNGGWYYAHWFEHAPHVGDKIQVTYTTTYDPQHPLPEGADVTVLERAVQLPTAPGSVVTTQVATSMLLENGKWVDSDGMYRTDEAVHLTLKLGGEVVYEP